MGTLLVRHPTSGMPMVVNYCRSQVARRLRWVHLSTVKRKVQPLILDHAGIACNMTGGMIGALGVRVGAWNRGSLSGKG